MAYNLPKQLTEKTLSPHHLPKSRLSIEDVASIHRPADVCKSNLANVHLRRAADGDPATGQQPHPRVGNDPIAPLPHAPLFLDPRHPGHGGQLRRPGAERRARDPVHVVAELLDGELDGCGSGEGQVGVAGGGVVEGLRREWGQKGWGAGPEGVIGLMGG